MDRNTFLAFALSMLVFTAWLLYQADRHPADPEGADPATLERSADAGLSDRLIRPDEAAPAGTPGLETADTGSPEGGGRQEEPLIPEPVEPEAAAWEQTLELGRYRVRLTNLGAAVESWQLKSYVERTAVGDVPIELVEFEDGPPRILATPFQELGIGDLSVVRWEVETASESSVAFRIQRGGLLVRKVYGFEADGYGFRLAVEVRNDSGSIVQPRFEVLWPAHVREGTDFDQQSFILLREGSVERELLSGLGVPGFFGGGDTPKFAGGIEWVGVDNRYFLGALLTDRLRGTRAVFEPVEPGIVGQLRLSFEPVELPPGKAIEHSFRGFMGPKRPPALDGVDETLELSMNRGWSWIAPLTELFEWLLVACYSVVPNYGLAIILLTLLVRVVTLPIMSRQMKSMERMRAVQPKLKEIQEKYADDRQKQSEAMMSLYKTEGVNPLGGCLPMLLQFPVFIGLFYALQSSFELRHADFMLWIDDLSAPESLFVLPALEIPVRVLPLIMGASMVVQQRLTPTTIDPAQARMMMTIMPVMFTVLFYQFPSGLVLYWMISNVIGIAHQMWVGHKMRTQEQKA